MMHTEVAVGRCRYRRRYGLLKLNENKKETNTNEYHRYYHKSGSTRLSAIW